jgi:AraC family transcriptional regulator
MIYPSKSEQLFGTRGSNEYQTPNPGQKYPIKAPLLVKAKPHSSQSASVLGHTSTQAGLKIYSQLFTKAGGREIHTLMHTNDSCAVSMAMYASPPYNLNVAALSTARLCLNLTAASVNGGLQGDRPKSFDSKRYSLFLTPAGAGVQWRKDAWSRHLNVYFNPLLLKEGDEDKLFLNNDAPLFNVQVPGVRHIADLLIVELERPDSFSIEATDSLARLLLVRLIRRTHRTAKSSSQFSPQLLCLLRDYSVENLDKRIAVADLAAIAGMTPNHFAHAFSEHTGQPPHQFVLKLRLQQAISMLQQSTLSLIDIASACGFSSQQHLTQTMRLRIGTTPGRYRTSTGYKKHHETALS